MLRRNIENNSHLRQIKRQESNRYSDIFSTLSSLLTSMVGLVGIPRYLAYESGILL